MDLNPQEALRGIINRYVPRDDDDRYTSHFAEEWYRAILQARRVIVTEAPNSRIHLSWVDANGTKLLELNGRCERYYPFVTEWASWTSGLGGYDEPIDDRRGSQT